MAFPCSGYVRLVVAVNRCRSDLSRASCSCAGCGSHTDQPFAAANSSSLKHVTCEQETFFQCKHCDTDNMCGISQAYMEGSSWEAVVVEDNVYLGGVSSFSDESLSTKFMFGCQKKETGLFITQRADGIMGLANSGTSVPVVSCAVSV